MTKALVVLPAVTLHDVAAGRRLNLVLSDHERRRFELIAGELAQDSSLSRLDARGRAEAKRRKTPGRRRRRGLVEWAEQRFAERMRRDRGW